MLKMLYSNIGSLISLPLAFCHLSSSTQELLPKLGKGFCCIPASSCEHTQLWDKFQTSNTLLGFSAWGTISWAPREGEGAAAAPRWCWAPRMLLGACLNAGKEWEQLLSATSTCSSRWRWGSSEERSVQPLCSYGLNSFSSHIYESIVNSPVALDASNYWLWYSCSFTASLEELLPLCCFQRRLHSCPRMVVMCSARCIVWFLIFLKAKCFVSLEHFHSRVTYRQLSIQRLEGLCSVWVEAGGVNGAHHLCRIPRFLGQPWDVGVPVLWINTHPSCRNHCREGQRAPGEVCWLLGRTQKCWMKSRAARHSRL